MNIVNIIAEKVRDYWRKTIPETVIVLFRYKYSFENDWAFNYVLVSCESDSDYDTVIFDTDFYEGQRDIKDIKIISLWHLVNFYIKIMGV